ncbi:hypothetical protein OG2516_16444 [Oceanicola granulosus HTCC2516]|uniref:AI-2E family transporter n=1 Tax=Oceanicola granulosus (strain ATCC BAA-861 / DSM 15982 / KCTC 12143 / HTCC2516) TaxID=314256 RepID=Q2CGM7_OCEGH|nr:hypothetical protein [Oceanicola granulosus]EAR51908.1 hypothetical protein OG2516_16444 [Oceanicola granulosus HTCC2516]
MNTLTAKSARFWRGVILAMSIASLVMVFQPFFMPVFALGCVLAFVSALVFNLMPFLQAGGQWRQVGRAALIICLVFAVVFALAIAATYGYVLYLQGK